MQRVSKAVTNNQAELSESDQNLHLIFATSGSSKNSNYKLFFNKMSNLVKLKFRVLASVLTAKIA